MKPLGLDKIHCNLEMKNFINIRGINITTHKNLSRFRPTDYISPKYQRNLWGGKKYFEGLNSRPYLKVTFMSSSCLNSSVNGTHT